MRHRSEPPQVAELFEKAGRAWSLPERSAFDQWLLVPEQFARDAAVAALVLHREAPGLASQEDVEDVLVEFYGFGLNGVVRNYDPASGDQTQSPARRFWAFYSTSLRNLGRKHAGRLRSRSRVELPPIDQTTDDGHFADDSVPDPNAASPEQAAIGAERARMLRDCIDRVLTTAERELVRDRLDEVPFADLAMKFKTGVVALRVRHSRALQKLKQCMTAVFAPKPSAKTSAKAPSMRAPDVVVDVLIIGGGVMGMFLLNDLRPSQKEGEGSHLSYSALLLDQDRLGGGQTCHSHLYIHDGHVYGNLPLASVLKKADQLWRAWLAKHPEVERAFTPAIFGFRTPLAAERARILWEHPDLQLQYEKMDPPPAVFDGGQVAITYKSPEICIRGHSLVEALKRPVDDFISLSKALTFSVKAPNRIERVDALLPNGEQISICARAVVLAAGGGNQLLLNSIASAAGTMAEDVGAAQQIRQSHMLVVRGNRDELPPLTGVFNLSPRTLFIVARECGDEVVWLVSDDRGPLAGDPRTAKANMDQWRGGIDIALRELVPTVFAGPRNLRCLLYPAPKAEGRTQRGTIPNGPVIEQYGENLWAVWPTKLTLAPIASRDVVTLVADFLVKAQHCSLPSSLPPNWLTIRCDAPSAFERWQEARSDEWENCRG